MVNASSSDLPALAQPQRLSRTNTGAIAFIASVALTAGVLLYIFTSISLDEVLRAIGQADRPAVAAFFAVSLSTSAFRMWRYRVLLRCNGYETPIPSMFLVVLIRNTFSDLLPARLGTLIYIFLVTTRLGIPLSAATSSFALALLFDTLAIMPLVLLCLVVAGSGHGLSLVGIFLAALVLAGATGSIIFLLPRILVASSGLVERISLFPPRLRQKLESIIEATARGVEHTQQSGVYGRIFVLSVIIRAGKYLGLYLFLFALLSPRGYLLSDLPFPTVFLGLCASEFAASLPISGIAGFGAYQGAWVTTFSLLGFPLELSKLTSVAHHLFTQAYGYALGGASLVLILLPNFRRAEQPALPSNKLSPRSQFAATVFVSLATLAATVIFLLRQHL